METVIRTRLENGTPVLLRPITVDDEARLRQAIDSLSDRSRYLRFFSGARHLPASVIHTLADADGHRHIAWGIMDVSGKLPRAIAAAHAIRADEGPDAELAFGVLDAFHGLGLGRLVVAAVILDCLHEGIERLTADTLAENRNAKRLLRCFGAQRRSTDDPIVHRHVIALDEALARIHGMTSPAAIGKLIPILSGQFRGQSGWAA